MRAFRHCGTVLALLIGTLPLVSQGVRADELLVMPYSCRVVGGQPVLTPSEDKGHPVIGRRETEEFRACSPANPDMCRRWNVHRFDLDCGGVRVPWVEVAAAAARDGRAFVSDGYLELEMPPRWGMGPDAPCARGGELDGVGFGGMERFCAERMASARRVTMPRGFAPMFGIDGIFVNDSARRGRMADAASPHLQWSPSEPSKAQHSEPAPQREPEPVKKKTPPKEPNSAPPPSALADASMPEVSPEPEPDPVKEKTPLKEPAASPIPSELADASVPGASSPESKAVPAPKEAATAQDASEPKVLLTPKEPPAQTEAPGPKVAHVPMPEPAKPDNAPGAGPAATGSSPIVPEMINGANAAKPQGSEATIGATGALPDRSESSPPTLDEPLVAQSATTGSITPAPNPDQPASVESKDAVLLSPLTVSGMALKMDATVVTVGSLALLTLLTVAVVLRRGRVPAGSALSRDIAAVSFEKSDMQDTRTGTGALTLVADPPVGRELDVLPTLSSGPPVPWGDDMPRTREDALRVLGIGVGPDVNEAAVKKIIDGLRLSWHPDHARDAADRATRELRLKQINAAWDIIAGQRAS